MKLRLVSIATLVLLGSFSSVAMAQNRATYIVQLAAEPTASYAGNVAGYAATQPVAGTRFNARSPAALAYQNYLSSQQNTVISLVGNAPIVARYNTAYNGFAASLTQAEVTALRASPLVVEVFADEARKVDTISTPSFLGLSAPGGLWSQPGLNKGEDIIIGVVDGGIWPESPSFSDRIDSNGTPTFGPGTQVYSAAPAGWAGTCVAGEGFVPATHCNNKLIGAQFFNAGFNAFLASYGRTQNWSEFSSPRDSLAGSSVGLSPASSGHGGHGSHTASTAGGNSGAPVVLGGVNMGTASGMAPRARIAAYKVCYTYDDTAATDGTNASNSCFTTDSVAAIDKAVADGVNVINYSISGSQTSVNDPVEQAFLRAAKAGVFVAASAGNSGPGQAVAHVSPWLTTVAASTHNRAFTADVTLGNSQTFRGASINATALPATAMIRAQDAGLAGVDATSSRLCFNTGLLDSTKVTGKVVVCDRGTNARVDKSLAVKNAGGIGMVLVDNGAGLVAEVHSVPTVHVTAADGAVIKSYAATLSSTAAISAFTNTGTLNAPVIAGFSSRGPNAGDNDMLKPDLTAPGVDVIATVSGFQNNTQRASIVSGALVPGAEWATYQGTSMSSPHVAGLGALLRQAHPTWSPSAIKSALMTSAFSTLDDGQAGMANGMLPWAQGAGHVAPNSATDPGLVYDNNNTDFIRYQCKVNKPAVVPASDCTTWGTLDQSYNYNLPSITVGAVVGSITVTRKVTNVGVSTATYQSNAAVPGFSTLITPANLTLAPGQVGMFTLKLTNVNAVANQWNYGSLSWSDGTHSVRSPVTARSAGNTIGAPALVTGTTVSGTRLVTLNTGFAGRMSANKGGMKAVTMGPTVSLTQSGISSASLKAACATGADTASVKVYPVSIPAGTIVARFALRDVDVGAAGDDNDMGILAPDGTWVYSGNDGSNELVQITSPAAGNYNVCVGAFVGSSNMTHTLSSWVVSAADASSSLNVLLPGSVVVGGKATVGFAWSGLAAGGRYVGGAQFKDTSAAVQATTVVLVDTTGAAPVASTTRAVSTTKLGE